MFPLIKPDFLAKEDIAKILGYIEKNQESFGELKDNDYWAGRVIHAAHIIDREIRNLLILNRTKVANILRIETKDDRPLYSDTLQLVRWPVGYGQEPHADAENHNGSPHPFPWRDFASIIYLNDNYEGGSIYFPKQNIEVNPTPGMLGTFPGTLEYEHGVRPITGGMQYTIASFFTWNLDRHDGLPI